MANIPPTTQHTVQRGLAAIDETLQHSNAHRCTCDCLSLSLSQLMAAALYTNNQRNESHTVRALRSLHCSTESVLNGTAPSYTKIFSRTYRNSARITKPVASIMSSSRLQVLLARRVNAAIRRRMACAREREWGKGEPSRGEHV